MKATPVLLAALVVWGCEAPLDPIADSDLVYSMSGYLDASADTQWVRVEPFGRTSAVSDAPLDADVTLVLPDGQRQPMTQEVRTFATGPAHLFRSTADILPGQTYHVEVRGPDGRQARAEVEIPDVTDLDIELVDGIIHCPTAVFVGGAEFLVDVQARYTVRGSGRSFRFSKAESFSEAIGERTQASIYFGDDALDMEVPPLPWESGVTPEIFVAIGTDDWLAPSELTLEAALAQAGFSHIEGGVGFVGGVVTRRIPFVPGVGAFPRPYSNDPFEPCFAP